MMASKRMLIVTRFNITISTNTWCFSSLQTKEIKNLVNELNNKDSIDANTACKLIDDIRNNIDFIQQTDKTYTWTTMLNICDYHKLPEIYCHSIWHDIKYYHKQNKTRINQQCLSSLILYYLNNQQFKQVMDILYWIDNQYNINLLNNQIITLNDKVYNMILSKLNKSQPNRNFPKLKYLESIKYIHLHLAQYNIQNIRIYNTLISAYAKYDDISMARNVFNNIKIKQTDTYNAMIGGYINLSNNKYNNDAMLLYQNMKSDNIKPDHVTYLYLIKACGNNLDQLMQIDGEIINNGFGDNIKIINSLIQQYSTCGNIEIAKSRFNDTKSISMDSRLFKTMMKCLTENGCFADILSLYDDMKQKKMEIDDIVYLHVIGCCSMEKNVSEPLKHLKRITDDIRKSKLYNGDIKLLNSLITQYGKCNDIENAIKIFDNIDDEKNKNNRNFITYSAMMNVFAEADQFVNGMKLYQKIKELGMKHNVVSYLVALKLCKDIVTLTRVHQDIIDSKMNDDLRIKCSLIYQYSKCGDLQRACDIFKSIPNNKQNIITFTTMMQSYKEHQCLDDAMKIYMEMKKKEYNDIEMNNVCYLVAIPCCNRDKNNLMMVHKDILRDGLNKDVKILTALIIQYIKCGDIEIAQKIFNSVDGITNNVHDITTIYNATMSGLTQMEKYQDALMLYEEMKDNDNINSDVITYLLVIKSCRNDLKKLIKIDDEIKRQSKYNMDIKIICALMTQYAKCGDLRNTKLMIDKIDKKDRNKTVYDVMLQAMYSFDSLNDDILDLYDEIIENEQGIHVNRYMYQIVLRVCGNSGNLDKLKKVHNDMMINSNYCQGIGILNELIVYYKKCGANDIAQQIFDSIEPSNRNEWTYKAIQ